VRWHEAIFLNSNVAGKTMAIDSPNTLTLRRFCGDEIYRIVDATMMAWSNDDGGIDLNLEINSEPDPIQSLKDTSELRVKPNAEITLPLPSLDPDALTGRSFQIPRGTTEDDNDFSGRLYYHEHEGVWSNHVEFFEQAGNRFHVKWTGETCDVIFYDGSKPPTKVEIDAIFTFDEYLKWK